MTTHENKDRVTRAYCEADFVEGDFFSLPNNTELEQSAIDKGAQLIDYKGETEGMALSDSPILYAVDVITGISCQPCNTVFIESSGD